MSPGQVYLIPSVPNIINNANAVPQSLHFGGNQLLQSAVSMANHSHLGVGQGIMKRSSQKIAHNRKQSQIKTRNDLACISVAVGNQLYSLQNLNNQSPRVVPKTAQNA